MRMGTESPLSASCGRTSVTLPFLPGAPPARARTSGSRGSRCPSPAPASRGGLVEASGPVVGRHGRIRVHAGGIGDAQTQLRGGEARSDARECGRDIPEGLLAGDRMAQITRSRIPIHHDTSTARRIAGFGSQRPRNRVSDRLETHRLTLREDLRARDQYRSRRGERALARQASVSPWFFKGSERTRLPVAAKIALHTAGAIDAWPGSPTPPQKPPEGASTTSTLGISRRRIMR